MILFVLVFILGIVSGSSIELEKLIAPDAETYDYYGVSVAISGNVAVIGSSGDDDNASSNGAAYVYRHNGADWNLEAKLHATSGDEYDLFGVVVDVSGNALVVTSTGDDDNGSSSGAAYVFRHDGADWNLEAKIFASSGAASDNFGRSVSMSGDLMIIGSPGNGAVGGSAFVFRHDGAGNWNEEALLTAFDGEDSDNFGSSVSISGVGVAIVGSKGDDDNGSYSGSAYIFRNFGQGNWTHEAKLFASEGEQDDIFGSSVSISAENVAVVGSPGDDDEGDSSGAAYIFRANGAGSWVEEAKLLALDGGGKFGRSVSISTSGDVLVVGSNTHTFDGVESGAAYIFRHDNGSWTKDSKLLASDRDIDDLFGFSVDLSGDVIIVGSSWDGDSGPYSGSAYLFASCGMSDDFFDNSSLSCQPCFGTVSNLDCTACSAGEFSPAPGACSTCEGEVTAPTNCTCAPGQSSPSPGTCVDNGGSVSAAAGLSLLF